MIWMTRRLARDFGGYETSVKWAIGMGAALLVLSIAVFLFGGETTRLPALIGGGAVLIAMQISVMVGNRHLVTPYTAAQRAYLANDFHSVLALLQPLLQTGEAGMREQTLLGNAWRQLGMLDESRQILYETLHKYPDQHFPQYGFGRTLLSEGDYTHAAEALKRALALGAPQSTRLDIAEACYYGGQLDAAREMLIAHDTRSEEPHRALMIAHLRARLGTGESPDAALIAEGLPYWQSAAGRFAHTPYGQALAAEIQSLNR